MQSAQEIALTPALSPEEREKLSCNVRHSLISDSFQRGQTRLPLRGAPGGRGIGEGEPTSYCKIRLSGKRN